MNTSAANHLFAHPNAIWLLCAMPFLTICTIVAARRRRRILARVGRLAALAALTERRPRWRWLRNSFLGMGLTILAIAVAGPQWGREPETATAQGRDLMVVLDLSRSMLAEDVLPSRIKRAQNAVAKLVEQMKRRGGHRIGLVTFAARAKVACPLTHDYDHFLEKLADLDPDQPPEDIRPHEGDVSGTRIGAGIAAAVAAHDNRFHDKPVRDILLLSDGDDPRGDNEWLKAGVEAAKAEGIPVYTVGIGDPVQGGRIPSRDGYYVKHQGNVVWSKLEEKPLTEIATRTKGTYSAARTDEPDLVGLFKTKIAPGAKRETVDDALPIYRQRYPWFIGIALVLVTLDLFFGTRRP